MCARLIRGLASNGFEEAVSRAYDAMRGAGVRVAELPLFPPPPPSPWSRWSSTIHQLRASQPSGWSPAQQEHLDDVLEGCARILEASHVEDAAGRSCAPSPRFPCNLQKLKRGNPTYDLLKRTAREQLKGVEYPLIQQLYAAASANC